MQEMQFHEALLSEVGAPEKPPPPPEIHAVNSLIKFLSMFEQQKPIL